MCSTFAEYLLVLMWLRNITLGKNEQSKLLSYMVLYLPLETCNLYYPCIYVDDF